MHIISDKTKVICNFCGKMYNRELSEYLGALDNVNKIIIYPSFGSKALVNKKPMELDICDSCTKKLIDTCKFKTPLTNVVLQSKIKGCA